MRKKRKTKKKDIIKFSVKKTPLGGVISVMIGVLSLVIFIFLCMASAKKDGNGDSWIGWMGCVLILINSSGFVLALKTLKKEEIHYWYPNIGVVLNGTMIIGCMILYIWGAVQ